MNVLPQTQISVRVTTNQECRVFFEPWGTEHRLLPEDEVLLRLDPKSNEDHLTFDLGRDATLSIWLPNERWEAFDKAGNELQV